jgi:hypothetical protein
MPPAGASTGRPAFSASVDEKRIAEVKREFRSAW